ncbi:hypothetical protein Tco_1077292 [Tanacetum coccineum]
MSDSEDSTVTYTEVSSPFKDLSDIGSSRVDGLPMMLEDPYVEAALQAPPSPDYVPGPEHPPSTVYVPYVMEPVYPEFMPPEDEVFPAEEQPLPAAVSPTIDSPRYIADSNLEEDEEDPEEDPADYLGDGGDDDDNDDESSDDDEDDDDDDDVEEDEDEEEEEHLAPTDSVPPPIHCVTARMSVRAQTPISLPSDTKILSPPLPVSPPPLPASPTYALGYRAAMIRLRATSPFTSHPLPLPSPIVLPHTRSSVAVIRAAAPSTYILASRSETLLSGTPPLLTIPLPTPSPPLLLPSTDCRAGVFEVTLPPRKRLYIALGLRFEVGESSSTPNARPTRGFRVDYVFVGTLDDEIRRYFEREVGYGITDTWDRMVEDMHGTPAATDVAGLSQWMTDFVTTVKRDTDEIYGRLDDSMDASDTARSKVRVLRTTVLAHQAEISRLRIADRTGQAQLVETLILMRTLQTQVIALQSQQGPASGLAQPRYQRRPVVVRRSGYVKMEQKRTTRSTPATTTTPTTSVTDEQLKRLIDEGVTDALPVRDADKSQNSKDGHDSGTGVRRQAPPAQWKLCFS